MEKVARKLIHEFFAQYEPVKEELYVIYSEGLDLALKERLDRELRSYGVPSPVWVRTGCVITTHCGPGSFGLAGFAGK
jgi:fatty acid-binding protein DegV